MESRNILIKIVGVKGYVYDNVHTAVDIGSVLD